MPNDAQEFTPTEQAILIALYRWQYDPPAQMRVMQGGKLYESRHPIPSVPYAFLEAELQPEHSGYEIRNSLLILEKLGLIQELISSDYGAQEGDEDYDEEIYEGPHVEVGACVGLWRLADGRYLDASLNDYQFEHHKHKIKERVIIDPDCVAYYVLADSALTTVRQLLFAEDHRRAAPTETETLEAEHGGGERREETKLRDLRAAIAKLGPDAKPDSIIAEVRIGNQEARKRLRTLEAAGEYSGFARPVPRSVP